MKVRQVAKPDGGRQLRVSNEKVVCYVNEIPGDRVGLPRYEFTGRFKGEFVEACHFWNVVDSFMKGDDVPDGEI